MRLTHIDDTGAPRMVDVGDKPVSERRACARGRVTFMAEAWQAVREHGSAKGDIGSIARIAGIMAAKRTSSTIPLCHTLALSAVEVSVVSDDEAQAFEVTAEVRATARTGVEMEALAAVSAACLTIYDMTKSISQDMVIGDIALEEKSGGRSGDYRRARSR